MRVVPSGFSFFELRTVDVAAAAAFYADVAGLASTLAPNGLCRLIDAAGRPWGAVVALPPEARAHGAPAHWLGHVEGVRDRSDFDALLRAGAVRLGPARTNEDGRSIVGLRDAAGAPFALSFPVAGAAAAGASPVTWHELHAADATAALACYAALGWRAARAAPPPTGPSAERDAYVVCAWDDLPARAAIVETVRAGAGIHPHWSFAFGVADLDRALRRVEAAGGRVLRAAAAHPSGARLAPCADAQGAAFALREQPLPAP